MSGKKYIPRTPIPLKGKYDEHPHQRKGSQLTAVDKILIKKLLQDEKIRVIKKIDYYNQQTQLPPLEHSRIIYKLDKYLIKIENALDNINKYNFK